MFHLPKKLGVTPNSQMATSLQYLLYPQSGHCGEVWMKVNEVDNYVVLHILYNVHWQIATSKYRAG